MFSTVLVANRGEIACRVIRTAQRLGYRAVAVYSDADAGAPHVQMADQAVRIGPAAVGESYLSVPAILDAAARSGADAVHPGYGFLSENAGFARACADAGLTFVGPPPGAIEAMGDKAAAKARMLAAEVPCVPGFQAEDPDDATLIAAADGVGYPLLVKASAGGGGRGMRRVDDASALPAALASARREAEGAFGSGHLLLERLVEHARHVEVQVIADTHGQVWSVGERDCSVQRRHQKVVEEAPSPAVDGDLRRRMGEAACRAARAVDYVGAGTVEFLLDADGSFYFLEMNTRLQVEHPVTEEVFGLDLVELQLKAAAGERLDLDFHLPQDGLILNGHAIEVRLYAEEPAADYAPRTGTIARFIPPSGEGIRVDHGLVDGLEVSAFYDPMLAKIIAWGETRAVARRRLITALHDTVVIGVTTNRAFLIRVLASETFAAGEATTHMLDQQPELAQEPEAPDPAVFLAAHLARVSGSGFRSAHKAPQTVVLDLDGEQIVAGLGVADGSRTLTLGERTAPFVLHAGAGAAATLQMGAHRQALHLHADGDRTWVQAGGVLRCVQPWDPTPAPSDSEGADGVIRAPSAARVLSVSVAPGDPVHADQSVAIVEAMKLETSLPAGVDGTVAEVRVSAGDAVAAGQVVVVITPDPVSPDPS